MAGQVPKVPAGIGCNVVERQRWQEHHFFSIFGGASGPRMIAGPGPARLHQALIQCRSETAVARTPPLLHFWRGGEVEDEDDLRPGTGKITSGAEAMSFRGSGGKNTASSPFLARRRERGR
jgi:hypothetical protein